MSRLTQIFIVVMVGVVSTACFARVSDRQKELCVGQKIARRMVVELPARYHVVPSRLKLHASFGPDAFLMMPGNLIARATNGKFPRIETNYVDFLAIRGSDVIHGWVSIVTRPAFSGSTDVSDCTVIDRETRKPARIRLQVWGIYSDSTEIQNQILKQQAQRTSALTAWTYAQKAQQAQSNSSDDSKH